VDESSLTGEARAVTKQAGDSVSGGTINVGSTPLVIQTTTSVEDSAVSKLIRLVEEAQANRSPTEQLVDSFAKAYTPFVISLAAVMCTIPWFWGHDVGRYWTLNGLIIVVIACPCALTISTPVTYAAGLAATARRGVIVKGGSRLEALGFVKKVVFDKTGTLTKGKFAVRELQTIGNKYTRRELLQLLAATEAPSSHPLSQTLVNAAKSEGLAVPDDWRVTHHTILKGEGISARINGTKLVYVGNQRLFTRIGMYQDLPTNLKALSEQWAHEGGTVGFVGVQGDNNDNDNGILGCFCVTDTIREEAQQVVRELMQDGLEVIMLTGDGDGPAKAVGRMLGLPESCIYSQLLPEDKLRHVNSLKEQQDEEEYNNGNDNDDDDDDDEGNNKSKSVALRSLIPSYCGGHQFKTLVLMVGDGVNDAPALAVADVGVAMGEGAAFAMEKSDITLMDSSLSKLRYSIQMGSRVVTTIQENIAFSIFSKLLVVALTFMGKMTLFGAIASDVGTMLLVTLNGMKLLPGQQRTFDPTSLSLSNNQQQQDDKTTPSYRRKASKKYTGLPSTNNGDDAVMDDDDNESDLEFTIV